MVGYELKFSVKNLGDPRTIIVEIFYGWASTTYWYIFPNTPKNHTWHLTWYGSYDLEPGTYYAYGKAWEDLSGGFFANDLVTADGTKVGEQWWNCTGVGKVFDSKTQTIVYSLVAGVEMTNFDLTVPY